MRYYDRKPMSNEEIVRGYEEYGETATDALRDARSFGYLNQYNRGFAHGAICAGIGCLIGGAVDLLMAKRDNSRNIQKAQDRLYRSQDAMIAKERAQAREQVEEQYAREDNND